jgi:hypothetical protein
VEIRQGRVLPFVQPRLDLVNEYIAAPAMLDSRAGIPSARLRIAQRLEKLEVVTPRMYIRLRGEKPAMSGKACPL